MKRVKQLLVSKEGEKGGRWIGGGEGVQEACQSEGCIGLHFKVLPGTCAALYRSPRTQRRCL